MSNVRSAARGSMPGDMYSASNVISSPTQAYTGTAPTTLTAGNRYPQYNSQPPAAAVGTAFDSIDRRTDIGNMFVPMQPDQYSSLNNRIPQQTQQQPSFYSAGVVSAGQPGTQAPPQVRGNPFSPTEQQSPNLKDGRRGSGMDVWPSR